MDGWLSRMWIESKVVDRCLLLNQLNVLIDVNERSHKLLAAFVRATGSRHFSVAEQRSEGETEGGIDVGREHGSQWVSCDPAPLMKSFFFCHLSPLLSSLSPPPLPHAHRSFIADVLFHALPPLLTRQEVQRDPWRLK